MIVLIDLQRVKNPPIPLKEFASIDSMREEINEVVAFLQNPRAFQDMGARAPRVCLHEQMMFASDFTVCSIHVSYVRSSTVFTKVYLFIVNGNST